MTRFAMALIHGDNVLAMTTYNKGKGKVPEAPPMIAPKPPVEEASVEIEKNQDRKKRTGKASLKMPLAKATNTGLKL